MSRTVPPLAMLVALTALGPFALNAVMPAMPVFPAAFDTTYALAQLTLSAFLASMAIFQLVYGPVSDRYGRRPIVLAALVLYIIGSVVCFLAPTIEALIAGRVLQAIGACGGFALSRAIVRDTSTTEESTRKIAYMTMAMVLAPMLAPLIAGVVTETLSWRVIFLVTALGGVGVLAAALVLLPETNKHAGSARGGLGLGAMVGSFGHLLRRPAYLGYAGQTAMTSAGFFAFLGGAPYVVQDLIGASPSAYGLWFMVAAVGYMSGNFVSGKLAGRFPMDATIGFGVGFCILGSGLMLVFSLAGHLSMLAIFGPMIFLSFGNGLSIANGTSGALSIDPSRAGAAAGLTGFLQMSCGAGASILVGWLIAGQDTAAPMILVMLASAVLGAVIHALLVFRTSRSESSMSVASSAG